MTSKQYRRLRRRAAAAGVASIVVHDGQTLRELMLPDSFRHCDVDLPKAKTPDVDRETLELAQRLVAKAQALRS